MSDHDCNTAQVAEARNVLITNIKAVKAALLDHINGGDRDHAKGIALHHTLADLQRAADLLGYGGTVTRHDLGR